MFVCVCVNWTHGNTSCSITQTVNKCLSSGSGVKISLMWHCLTVLCRLQINIKHCVSYWGLLSCCVKLAWSYRVSSSKECCPAGSAEAGCSDVVRQLHSFLCQLVNIGSPVKHNSSAITGKDAHFRLFIRQFSFWMLLWIEFMNNSSSKTKNNGSSSGTA